MVTWTIFKIHLLEVGLAQNWDIMALQNLTTVDLMYFLMCEDCGGEFFVFLLPNLKQGGKRTQCEP